MKYNLKNRPMNHTDEFMAKYPKVVKKELDEWFEGFEKELREIKDDLFRKGKIQNMVAVNLIKEILGDEG